MLKFVAVLFAVVVACSGQKSFGSYMGVANSMDILPSAPIAIAPNTLGTFTHLGAESVEVAPPVSSLAYYNRPALALRQWPLLPTHRAWPYPSAKSVEIRGPTVQYVNPSSHLVGDFNYPYVRPVGTKSIF